MKCFCVLRQTQITKTGEKSWVGLSNSDPFVSKKDLLELPKLNKFLPPPPPPPLKT